MEENRELDELLPDFENEAQDASGKVLEDKKASEENLPKLFLIFGI